jgi:hypothetical protein
MTSGTIGTIESKAEIRWRGCNHYVHSDSAADCPFCLLRRLEQHRREKLECHVPAWQDCATRDGRPCLKHQTVQQSRLLAETVLVLDKLQNGEVSMATAKELVERIRRTLEWKD